MKRLRSKRLYFLTLLIVACAILWLISSKPFNYTQLKTNTANTAQFIDIAKRTQTYTQEQQAALGMVADVTDLNNTCFQYPRPDNETYSLWCGSTVIKTISVQPNAQYITDLLKKLDPIVTKEHMKISISAGTNLSVDAVVYEASTTGPYESPTCGVSILHLPNGNTPKAVKDPTHIKYVSYCSAPSSGSVPGYRYLKNPNDGSFSQAGPLAIP